jgi:hypothetical protein
VLGLSRSASLTLIALALTLAGCDVGYKVDVRRNTVTWVTWDEGNGTRRWPVAGADARTFQVMPIPSKNGRQEFGRDKAHVYRESKRIEGADPVSFREFGPGLYRDDKSVFRSVFLYGKNRGDEMVRLPEADPETYRAIDSEWSRDAKRVFYIEWGFVPRGFVPRDIDSFEVLSGGWARDRVAIYFATSEIPRADRETFEPIGTVVFGKVSPFGKDRSHVFWRGWLIAGADPLSFEVTREYEGHDRQTNFYLILRDHQVCGPVYPAREMLEILRGPVGQTIGDGKP